MSSSSGASMVTCRVLGDYPLLLARGRLRAAASDFHSAISDLIEAGDRFEA